MGTDAPTKAPTKAPTVAPTKNPTVPPTDALTKAPTKAPTIAPTKNPTAPPVNPPPGAGVIDIDLFTLRFSFTPVDACYDTSLGGPAGLSPGHCVRLAPSWVPAPASRRTPKAASLPVPHL